MHSHEQAREARRLALGAIFEADFGQHTAPSVLERRIGDEGTGAAATDLARQIVNAVVDQRDQIDARIEALAPRYPVVQLARIDRALLRSAMAELLHCPATPARVAIAEWVDRVCVRTGLSSAQRCHEPPQMPRPGGAPADRNHV
jgi:N utilization substance protein B